MSNGIADLPRYAEGGSGETPEWLRLLARHLNPAKFLPLPARRLIADVTGNIIRGESEEGSLRHGLGDIIGSRSISERDFSPAQLRALNEAAARSMAREGSRVGDDVWQLNYDDYGLDDLADYISVAASGMVPQKFGGEVSSRREEYKDKLRAKGYGEEHIEEIFAQSPFVRATSHQVLKEAEGGQGVLEAIASSPSSFALAATLGSARIRRDPETGEISVEDEYDFNDAQLAEDTSYWADAAREGFIPTPGNIYGQLRNVGKHFGSQPGEGSSVRISLGDMGEDAGSDSGLHPIRDVLAWLRARRGDEGVPSRIPSEPPSLASFISPDFIPDFIPDFPELPELPREIMAQNILEE